jgi:hypothetical protein
VVCGAASVRVRVCPTCGRRRAGSAGHNKYTYKPDLSLQTPWRGASALPAHLLFAPGRARHARGDWWEQAEPLLTTKTAKMI